MIPLDSFMAHSADGRLVPVVPGGQNISLTFMNRTEYVEKALDYRLHEMDSQVCRGGGEQQHADRFPHSCRKKKNGERLLSLFHATLELSVVQVAAGNISRVQVVPESILSMRCICKFCRRFPIKGTGNTVHAPF